MSLQVRLREATAKDLKFVLGLLKSNNLCFEDIESKISSLFVGYAGSKIVGIGGVEVYGEVGLLRSIVVKEELRRQGLGKALILRIIEAAKTKGVKELYLLTTTGEGFFARLGFRKVKRESAPTVIRDTTEFKELCAVTSILMTRKIA